MSNDNQFDINNINSCSKLAQNEVISTDANSSKIILNDITKTINQDSKMVKYIIDFMRPPLDLKGWKS